MKESKAVYVTKKDIRENLLNREYQLYVNNVLSYSNLENKYVLTNDVGVQYNSKKDNVVCACRNLSEIRKRNEARRYFSISPRQIYTYHKTRSFTEIGVGSIKALQKKKVKKILLPETDDRGAGSAELSAALIRKSKQSRGFSYYEQRKTSSKCVGGCIIAPNENVVSAKVSPIIHMKSNSTSPENLIAYPLLVDPEKQLVTTTTQFEPEPEFEGIKELPKELLEKPLVKVSILQELIIKEPLPIQAPFIRAPSIREPAIQKPSIQAPPIQEQASVRPPLIVEGLTKGLTREPLIREGSIREPSIREGSIREPSIQGSIREPSIQGSIKEPSIQGSIKEPSIREGSIREPSIQGSIKKPSIQGSIKEPSIQGSIKEPSIQGSIKEPSIREGSIREPSIQGSIKEPSIREGSIKEPSIREGSIKEPSVREGSIKEPSVQEGSIREPSTLEGSTREPSTWDGSTTRETSTLEGSTREPSIRDGSFRDSSNKEGSTREASIREGSISKKEPSIKEETIKELTKKEPIINTQIKEKQISGEKAKEPTGKSLQVIKAILKGTESSKDAVFSSDSLVQHIHELEMPPEYRQGIDPMENKIEREYRKMFATNRDVMMPNMGSMPKKSTSLLRRRFTALRRSLGKKDSKKSSTGIMRMNDSTETSDPSVKDASVSSDPPSLEGRSFSNASNSPSYHPKNMYQSRPKHSKSSFKKSYTGKKNMEGGTNWSQAIDSEYATGVKGMFKLWGKKFNLEESDTRKWSEVDNNHKREEYKPQIKIETKPKVEAKVSVTQEKPKEKKEKQKFSFFRRKPSNKEKTNKTFNNKKGGVTTGRCELKEGLVLKLGAGGSNPDSARKHIDATENFGDIKRTTWLAKYLTSQEGSRKSLNLRWNNQTYATSSSTVFELIDNINKNAGVFRSKSETATSEESLVNDKYRYQHYSKRNVNFVQNIEAWMIPRTIPDQPMSLSKLLEDKKQEKENQHEKESSSHQKWCIDKSKAFAHKIELVLRTNNLVRIRDTGDSSDCLRIQIPQGYLSETSSDDDEEVYKIVEYETSSHIDIRKGKMKVLSKNTHTSDQGLKFTINVDDDFIDSNKVETVIKQPPAPRDIVIQGSNVYVPNKCDVIEVGIITQRNVRETGHPILKIVEYFSDDDSDRSMKVVKKCEFAESYLQDYYRLYHPLDMDIFSWCVSDSHLKCCSDDSQCGHVCGTKSCPNMYDDYVTMMSSCCPSSCSQIYPIEDESSFRNHDMIDRHCCRVLPKDSLEVFKKRKLYSAEKAKWANDRGETYSTPSNEDRGVQNNWSQRKPCFSLNTNTTSSYHKNIVLPDYNGAQSQWKTDGIASNVFEPERAVPGILVLGGCKRDQSGNIKHFRMASKASEIVEKKCSCPQYPYERPSRCSMKTSLEWTPLFPHNLQKVPDLLPQHPLPRRCSQFPSRSELPQGSSRDASSPRPFSKCCSQTSEAPQTSRLDCPPPLLSNTSKDTTTVPTPKVSAFPPIQFGEQPPPPIAPYTFNAPEKVMVGPPSSLMQAEPQSESPALKNQFSYPSLVPSNKEIPDTETPSNRETLSTSRMPSNRDLSFERQLPVGSPYRECEYMPEPQTVCRTPGPLNFIQNISSKIKNFLTNSPSQDLEPSSTEVMLQQYLTLSPQSNSPRSSLRSKSPSHSPPRSPQKVSFHSPQQTLPLSPQQTPPRSPQQTPSHSPQETQPQSIQQSPPFSPEQTLPHSPQLTPPQTPTILHSVQQTPPRSPQQTPSHSPQETQPQSIQQSPPFSPEQTLPHSPQLTPPQSPTLPHLLNETPPYSPQQTLPHSLHQTPPLLLEQTPPQSPQQPILYPPQKTPPLSLQQTPSHSLKQTQPDSPKQAPSCTSPESPTCFPICSSTCPGSSIGLTGSKPSANSEPSDQHPAPKLYPEPIMLKAFPSPTSGCPVPSACKPIAVPQRIDTTITSVESHEYIRYGFGKETNYEPSYIPPVCNHRPCDRGPCTPDNCWNKSYTKLETDNNLHLSDQQLNPTAMQSSHSPTLQSHSANLLENSDLQEPVLKTPQRVHSTVSEVFSHTSSKLEEVEDKDDPVSKVETSHSSLKEESKHSNSPIHVPTAYGSLTDATAESNEYDQTNFKLRRSSQSKMISHGFKITNDEGETIVERRDYHKATDEDVQSFSQSQQSIPVTYKISQNRTPLVNKISQNKTPPVIVNKMASIQREPDIKKSKSDTSITNIIEISFKLKVLQGDKTTEININEQNSNLEHTNKEAEGKSKEVFIMENKNGLNEDVSPQNGVNIRILIKSYKPKSSNKTSKTLEEFSQQISRKFDTVSAGHSIIRQRDADTSLSVHTAFIDLTGAVEKHQVCEETEDDITHDYSEELKSCQLTERSGISPDQQTEEPQQSDTEVRGECYTTATETEVRGEGYTTATTEKTVTSETRNNVIALSRMFKSETHLSISDTCDSTLLKSSDDPTDVGLKTSDEPDLTGTSDTDQAVLLTSGGTSQDQMKIEPQTDEPEPEASEEAPNETSQRTSEPYIEFKKSKKEEKKEMLKQVFEHADCLKKPKTRNRIRKLKDMLKAILTSESEKADSDTDPGPIVIVDNELATEVTYGSLKPTIFKNSESMNKYYQQVDSASKDATGSSKPLYPSATKFSDSDKDSLLSENEKKRNKCCVCTTFAKRLNINDAGGGCCCGQKKVPPKISKEIYCDLLVGSEERCASEKEVECVECQTTPSQFDNRVNSTQVSSIRTTLIDEIQNDIANQIARKTENLAESVVAHTKVHIHSRPNIIKECEIKKLNLKPKLGISAEDKIVFLESKISKSSKKTPKASKPFKSGADILQMYETKKAVLEIYAEKTVTKDGLQLVAKLPKYTYHRENEIYRTYQKLGDKSCVSMSPKR